ncbi:hypothetical protein [Polaromonas jejuensis]|uniref:Uncharacterized protein n=1 Tax=Polaromonas jejuensis TaxID=457502 RepID=A0ABW0Q6M5_9BURK|nr:hypothetical protein [Polaromonas jejuensis]
MKLFPLFRASPSRSRAYFSRLRLPLLLLGALWAGSNAWSQTVLDGAALLGMSRQQLASAMVDARPVRSPRRLSSGAVGLLRVPDVLCEGLHFEQTLFFGRHQLEQMDLVLLNPGSSTGARDAATAAGFASLVQSLRAKLGPELAASASTPVALMNSASWVSGDADVMLFRSGSPAHPSLRMVIRQRQLVDASEL